MNESQDRTRGQASEDTKPSMLANVVANATAAIRADADQLELMKAFESLNPDAIEKLTPYEARKNPTPADAVKVLLLRQSRSTAPQELAPGVTTRDIAVAGAQGSLSARVYTPAGQGPFPVIVYFHGGGWVIADKDVYDGGARGLCHETGATVLSVDYRRAPEHRFPAAWDDALAAYRWATEHAREIGGDPQRIALAGESAGGNLAVATAIAARDFGLPRPRHVLAVYPVAQTSLNTESYLENALAKPLNRAMMTWFFDHVTRTAADLDDPRLALVKADLRDLPPVTIINARLDPLRGDGAQLEDALRSAGVPVAREEYAGVAHEFFGATAVLEKARLAMAFAGARLRDSLGLSDGRLQTS